MKKVIFLLTTVLLFSCGESNDKIEKSVQSEPSKNHVAVYDFHTDHPCESCITIENLTKETLNENFSSNMKDSTITFTLINVDSPENQVMAEEYDAFGTALMITVFKDGEEDILDLTEWAFDAIHGDNFKSELKKELGIALKKL